MVLLLTGCTADDVVTVEEKDGQQMVSDDPTGQPVLFSVGNLNQTAITRSDVIPYMAQGGRFVCTMYYHAGKTDTDDSNYDIKHPDSTGTMTTAWLQVNNNVGNSVYRKKDFSDPTSTDTYDFDMDATNFYWQNRLKHAFLALADYNKLKSNVGSTETGQNAEQGKLKLYPAHDKDMVTLPDNPTEEDLATYADILANNRYANTYNLTKGEKTSISQQPDPIRALTIMKPAGATQEANRVRLYFKHQFSLIQVNLKGADDNSANITTGQIEKVELLGVTEEGYVPCRLNAGGTVGPATYKAVDLDSYTDEQLEDNPWGTSFDTFDMATGVDADGDGLDDGYAVGFLKSFNAIAYGYLRAIRITWHEGTSSPNPIEHVATFEVPLTTGEAEGNIPLQELQSGYKYIYNLELRRGTLAVIRTQIVDWEQAEELVYGSDGTITN